jgi:hypothetical protein
MRSLVLLFRSGLGDGGGVDACQAYPTADADELVPNADCSSRPTSNRCKPLSGKILISPVGICRYSRLSSLPVGRNPWEASTLAWLLRLSTDLGGGAAFFRGLNRAGSNTRVRGGRSSSWRLWRSPLGRWLSTPGSTELSPELGRAQTRGRTIRANDGRIS